MPSMPNYFAGKGSQFGLLDRQFGGEESEYMAAYDAALERIDAPLAELAERHRHDRDGQQAELSEDDVEHFREHWLGSWWREHPVEDVLRAGYAEAIRRARDAKLPIESLWICADEKTFQVYIVQGPRQITVIVFTPQPVEHVSEETLTEPEPIWVVKARDQWDKGETTLVSRAREKDIITKQLFYAPDPASTRQSR
jgi:hypothetical protein